MQKVQSQKDLIIYYDINHKSSCCLYLELFWLSSLSLQMFTLFVTNIT